MSLPSRVISKRLIPKGVELRRVILGTVAALAVAAAAAACSSSGTTGSSTSASGSTPYRVLVSAGLSSPGPLQVNSEMAVLAAKAGAKEVNAAGGIDGHQVQVTVVDDASTASTAVTVLQDALHSGAKPDLYLDSGPAPTSAAVLPILKSNGVLSLNTAPVGNSSNPADYPLNFDLSPGPADYVQGFLPAIKAAGYQKIGIIHSSDEYGTLLGTAYQSAFTKAGYTVTANEQYDVTALSMTPELQAIEATHPDVLVLDGYGAPIGYILKDLAQLGWNVPILADNSVAATNLISEPAPAGLLGTSYVKNLKMQVFNSTEYNASATVVNNAVAQLKATGTITASLILGYNYDAMLLVAAAAKAANSTDPAAIARELVVPSVLSSAKTAILARFNYTAGNHSPQPSPSEFTFIAPTALVDGQYGHPSS